MVKHAVTVALTCGAAAADIVPLSGIQAMSGRVEAFMGGVSQDFDMFALSAPFPLASWSPPVQDIHATSSHPDARVIAVYTSEISPTEIRLGTSADGMSTGNAVPIWAGQFQWDMEFELRFQVTTQTSYNLSAEVVRNNIGGWGGGPVSLTFGPEGQTPIVNLSAAHPFPPFPLVVSFSPTLITLPPGIYVVRALDTTEWGGMRDHQFSGGMTFKLVGVCYADCDGDQVLTLGDFGCFQTKFALADPYADCNGDGTLNLADFGCFQTHFALGCP